MFVPIIAVTDKTMHRRVANVIRTAIERSYGSINKACIDMDLKQQSHFNGALDGERGLPIGFLCLSRKFWAWFAVGLVEEFGVPRAVRQGAWLMLGAFNRRRMVKAQVLTERKVA